MSVVKRVLLGSPYVTTTIEDLPYEDYIFVGEAETTLPFFFSSRRRHTRFDCDWSSDVCSSDLGRRRPARASLRRRGSGKARREGAERRERPRRRVRLR